MLIGPSDTSDVLRLQGFLTRNGYPHHLLDPAVDTDAAELIARYSPSPADWPLVVVPDGTVLRNPSESQLARAMGMIRPWPRTRFTMSPLSAAAPRGYRPRSMRRPKGLRSRCAIQGAFGGQAGASARIENYLGFPTGIPGWRSTARAFNKAQKFGADIMISVEAKSLDCSRADGAFGLMLDDGEVLRARSIVVASGARYRRPRLKISLTSKAAASGIGHRRSRPGYAPRRKSCWSAAAIPPDRPRYSCRGMPAGSTW